MLGVGGALEVAIVGGVTVVRERVGFWKWEGLTVVRVGGAQGVRGVLRVGGVMSLARVVGVDGSEAVLGLRGTLAVRGADGSECGRGSGSSGSSGGPCCCGEQQMAPGWSCYCFISGRPHQATD